MEEHSSKQRNKGIRSENMTKIVRRKMRKGSLEHKKESGIF